jgi:hypothetical protein
MFHLCLAATVGNIVQVACGVGVVQVDRRRDDLVLEGLDADNGLNGPGGANRMWPIMDLVEEMGILGASAPKTVLMALVSATSFARVDVAWALM